MVRAVHELSPVERKLHDAYVKLAIKWFALERKGVPFAGLTAKAFCCLAGTLTVGYTVKQMWEAR